MGAESIRTQLDDLILALKTAERPLSVSELSSACGLSAKDTLKWLHVFEKQGQAHLENRISGVFVTWMGGHIAARSDSASALSSGKIFSSASQGIAQELEFARKTKAQARQANFEQEIDFARQREEEASQEKKSADAESAPAQHEAEIPQEPMPLRHKVMLGEAEAQMAEVGEQLEKVESMIATLRAQKELTKSLKERLAEKRASEGAAGPKAKKAGKAKKLRIAKGAAEDAGASQLGQEIPPIEIDVDSAPENAAMGAGELAEALQEMPAEAAAPAAEAEPAQPAEAQPEKLLPEREDELKAAFSAIKPLSQPLKKPKKEKIQKPQPLHVAGVSLQFSERLARQVQKILKQNQEIDRLRQEKEKLLAEHYLPMQRKLESEIETISDRVLRMEKNILGMQERASNLPNKVSAVEKLQLSSIKAHGQMRRVYDEAAALIEESARELSEEREKMETLVDQSRQEIASHRSKTVELEQTLQQISQLEGEASNRVIEARAALAEQAERLASAEKHSQELSLLKSEIVEGVSSIKREMGATKAVLTGLEKQMEQMRQVELYAQSIRQDYEQKMGELSNYIKHGNEDFETLRESVEANFVRRYLKELRELTESYGYEFAQAKKVEGSIDERIYDEKKRLEDLMEEGRKIAHLYELQSKEVQGAESFEKQGEKLAEIEQLAEKRTQIESMIAQIVGGRSALSPKVASAPIKARGYAKPKAAAAPKAKKAAKKSKLKTKQHSKSKSRKKKGRR